MILGIGDFDRGDCVRGDFIHESINIDKLCALLWTTHRIKTRLCTDKIREKIMAAKLNSYTFKWLIESRCKDFSKYFTTIHSGSTDNSNFEMEFFVDFKFLTGFITIRPSSTFFHKSVSCSKKPNDAVEVLAFIEREEPLKALCTKIGLNEFD